MRDSFVSEQTIIEKFDYEKHQQEAQNILALMIPFLVLTYILSLLAMFYLFQKKNYALFYVVFILLICPFLFTQILVFFLSLYIVCRYFFAIQWSQLPLTNVRIHSRSSKKQSGIKSKYLGCENAILAIFLS